MQPAPRFLRLALLAALTCPILGSHARPAFASPASFEWGSTFGPAISAGEGSGRLENGRTMAVEMLAREPGRNAWLLRADLTGFDRGASSVGNLQFFNGGRLYLPADGSGADPLRCRIAAPARPRRALPLRMSAAGVQPSDAPEL